MTTTLKHRRGSAAEWTSANPILSDGELGFERDTKKFKIGDGVTSWSLLKYFVSEETLASNYVPQWKALTVYTAGQAVLNPTGDVVTAKIGFTSGASYSAANWNLSGTYSPLLSPTATFTYNADGTIATMTVGGVATTYVWNADGTLATETRAGVTRTYAYVGANLTAVS